MQLNNWYEIMILQPGTRLRSDRRAKQTERESGEEKGRRRLPSPQSTIRLASLADFFFAVSPLFFIFHPHYGAQSLLGTRYAMIDCARKSSIICYWQCSCISKIMPVIVNYSHFAQKSRSYASTNFYFLLLFGGLSQ